MLIIPKISSNNRRDSFSDTVGVDVYRNPSGALNEGKDL
jgi:hypothetical protein